MELTYSYVLVQTTLHESETRDFRLKTIAYPLFTPLQNWLPYVAHKFSLSSTDGYIMKIVGKDGKERRFFRFFVVVNLFFCFFYRIGLFTIS